MILIKENKRLNDTYFVKETYNYKNALIYSDTIYYRTAIESKNKTPYYILYDENMTPIKDVFRFLNVKKLSQSENTREKGLYALKLLYSFCKIIDKSFSEFSFSDAHNFINFLRGISPRGTVISFQLLTIRNNETICGYLSVYRKFMEHLDIKHSVLLKKSDMEVYVYTTEEGDDKYVTPYAVTVESPSIVNEVPMYISVDEFNKILTIVRKDYTIREECIIRLMYQCGLRIGETLGLTADDVVIEKIRGEYAGIAYLRNRVSDKKDQHAKTCLKVNDKRQYKTKDYKKKGKGFQTVIVPMDLFDLINNYIDTAHVQAEIKRRKNTMKRH